MTDLITTLIATLQALVVLLAAQGSITPELQAQINSVSQATSIQQISQDPPSSLEPISFTSINQTKAGAVVNIICLGSGNIRSGTASGVIISPTGLVLVNAHMAQYMLLEQETNASVSCTVRTGSPARASYKAKVVYIPTTWVAKHSSQITEKEQYGTGEDDYAILQITEAIGNGSKILPSTFTHIIPNTDNLATDNNQNILIRAYPAELLGSQITMRSLHPTATVTQVKEVSTFANLDTEEPPTRDLISLGGSIVAQGGSSGGAVIDARGHLVGIVVTSTRAKQTSERTLRAITMSHVSDSLKAHTGKYLHELVAAMTTNTIEVDYQIDLAVSAALLVTSLNQ